jgi:hypothetical protein
VTSHRHPGEHEATTSPFYSLSVEAARRIRDKRLESTHLGYLAWADLVEQRDARTGLKRAQEALLAAKEANDDLALGWASLCKGWALNSLRDREAAMRPWTPRHSG